MVTEKLDKGGTGKRSVQVEKHDVMAWARGLIDLSPSLPKPVLHKAFKDWLAMLTTLYPELFAGEKPMLKTPTATDVDSILKVGYRRVLDLFAFLGGSDWASVAPPPTTGKEDATVGKEDDEEEGEALETEREDALLRETEPFLVRLATKQATAGAEWKLADLQVTRLVISDERPPTRFGNRQIPTRSPGASSG
jgi:hypothetical protein